MKYLIPVLFVVFLIGCNGMEVKSVDTNLGYFNFAPVIQKFQEQRKAACEADAECKEVKPLTQNEVLAILNSVKDQLKEDGSVIVGIEFDKSRIWIEKPVK